MLARVEAYAGAYIGYNLPRMSISVPTCLECRFLSIEVSNKEFMYKNKTQT
jgi:hypothetical protein